MEATKNSNLLFNFQDFSWAKLSVSLSALLCSFIHWFIRLLKRCCVLISTLIFKMINLIRNLHRTEPKRKYERKKCMQFMNWWTEGLTCMCVFRTAVNSESSPTHKRNLHTGKLIQMNFNLYDWLLWYVIVLVQNATKMLNASAFTVMGRFSCHFSFFVFSSLFKMCAGANYLFEYLK